MSLSTKKIIILKNFILSCLFLVSLTQAQFTPCSNSPCDSLVARTLLDTNGIPFKIGLWQDMVSVGTNDRIYFLHMPGLNIRHLPASLGKMDGLTHLQLGKNRIESLPMEIGFLKNLRQLDLNSNRLDQLPKEIHQLNNLVSLNLGFNFLCLIPDSTLVWLNSRASDSNWLATQLLNDSTRCDGTGILERNSTLFEAVKIYHHRAKGLLEIKSQDLTLRATLYSTGGKKWSEANGLGIFYLPFPKQRSGVFILILESDLKKSVQRIFNLQ